SLRYFYTAVTEPSEGQPALDGEVVFVRYDSETRRIEPRVPWMVGAVDPQYWDRNTQIEQANQQAFHVHLDTL
ncbi:HA1K protein, partial [Crypturellus undulatus]|nr:HA1K protein [Crypturellus undulatus]